MSFDIRSPHAKARGLIEIATMMALSQKDPYGRMPDVFAEEQASPAVRDVYRRRSAVDPGTTTDGDYASTLSYRPLSDDFVASLRNISGFDTIRPLSVQLPRDTSIAVASTVAVGSVVGEGAPKPVRAQSWSLTGPPLVKVVWLGVVNDEVLRSPFADRLLAAEARLGVAVGGDLGLLAHLASGATDVPASGATAAALCADFRSAVAAILTGAGSVVVAMAAPALVKRIALMTDTAGALAFPEMSISGGTIGGIVVVPCDAIEEDSSGSTITLVDATQVSTSDEGVTVRSSINATIEMSDTPTNPVVAATVLRSMFQQNQTAIIAERLIAYAKVRDGVAARITGANYGA